MLIARAPVRISFAGGGTDLEAYYERFGGIVISTTIDKYFYVFLKPNVNGAVQVSSSDYGTFYRQPTDGDMVDSGDLTLPRAILQHFGIRSGVSLFLASEIPPGTGLGSSSAVGVAVIKAASTALGDRLSRAQVANLACEIEIEKLAMPIGKQDQYASAFGGLNVILFHENGVEVQPLDLPASTYRQLQTNTMLFFTGASRNSATILRQQTKSSTDNDPRVIEALHSVKDIAMRVHGCLLDGDLERFGELLYESWEQKKRFASGVSNSFIDECMQTARHNGARGGKITGAGGGGFLMIFCDREHQDRVSQALEAKGLRRMDFNFDTEGARVLTNSTSTIPRHSLVSS